MSGVKHTKARPQAQPRTTPVQNREQRLERELKDAQDRVRRAMADATRRQDKFNSILRNLNSEIREQAQEFHSKVRKQQQELFKQRTQFKRELDKVNMNTLNEFQKVRREFSKKLDSQRTEYMDLIRKQSLKFNEKINTVHNRVDAVDNRISAMEDKAQQTKKRAAVYLDSASDMIQYIEKNLQHEKFAPDKLARLKSTLSQNQQNMRNEDFQAALANGQTLLSDTLLLQAEIESLQQEWQALYERAVHETRSALLEYEGKEVLKYVLGSNNNEVEAEVEYWSKGELSTTKTKIKADLEVLEKSKDDLSIDDLKAEIERNPERLIELEKLVSLAKERLLKSYEREYIAYEIAKALEASGYRCTDETWDNGDDRRERRHVKFQDPAGNEIVSIVIPQENTDTLAINNEIEFAYYPQNINDENFHRHQTQSINELLKKNRLGNQLQCVDGFQASTHGDEKRRDFAALRNSQATKKIP